MKNRPKGNFWFQESSAALIKKKKDEVSPSTGTSTKWLFSLGWEDGSEEVCASLPYLVPDRLLTSPKGTGARKERLFSLQSGEVPASSRNQNCLRFMRTFPFRFLIRFVLYK